MIIKLTKEEAKNRALEFMHKGFHLGPAILKVIWEAYDLKNEDLLLSIELAKEFEKIFGTIVCREMVEFNLSNPLEYLRFSDSGRWREHCDKAIEFAIDKFYEFEKREE